MTYSKILVGTDGSQTAQRAESMAARLPAATGAELVIASAYIGEATKADQVLEKAEKAASAIGVKARTEKVKGNPADGLVDLADRELAGAKRFLLGSVPDKISHHAPCDVLIARTTTRPGGR